MCLQDRLLAERRCFRVLVASLVEGSDDYDNASDKMMMISDYDNEDSDNG